MHFRMGDHPWASIVSRSRSLSLIARVLCFVSWRMLGRCVVCSLCVGDTQSMKVYTLQLFWRDTVCPTQYALAGCSDNALSRVTRVVFSIASQ